MKDMTPVEDFDWPCDRRDAHHPHPEDGCPGVGSHPATMAGGSHAVIVRTGLPPGSDGPS